LWLYFTHVGPYILAAALPRWASETWLPGQYPRDLLQGLALLYGSAAHTYSHFMAWLVLLPAALAIGLSVKHRRGFSGFLVLATCCVSIAFSLLGLMPLGPSRHSLYLAPVYVCAGGTAIAWMAARLAPPPFPASSAGSRGLRLALISGLVLLVLLPTGLYLNRIVRTGLPAVLGPSRLEFPVSRQSVETAASFVRAAPVDAWLTDSQTAMLLMPLARREDRVLAPEPAFGGSHLDVLGQRMAVLKHWGIREAFVASDDSIETALRWLTATSGKNDRRVGLVIGGWEFSEAFRLAMGLRAAKIGPVLAAGDETIAAVLVDPAILRTWSVFRSAKQK